MEVWLSYNNNEDKFQLPITPSGYAIGRGKNNTTVNINQLGDIKLIGKNGLKSLTIESYFPFDRHSHLVDSSEVLEAFEYVEYIEKWMETDSPIRVIFTDTPINLPMSIENFEYREIDGSGDVSFTLQLEEYIFLKKTKNSVEKSKRSTSKKIPKEYTTRKGDTLYKISKSLLGKGPDWKKIYNHGNNKKIIGKNPNILRVGLKLSIPGK